MPASPRSLGTVGLRLVNTNPYGLALICRLATANEVPAIPQQDIMGLSRWSLPCNPDGLEASLNSLAHDELNLLKRRQPLRQACSFMIKIEHTLHELFTLFPHTDVGFLKALDVLAQAADLASEELGLLVKPRDLARRRSQVALAGIQLIAQLAILLFQQLDRQITPLNGIPELSVLAHQREHPERGHRSGRTGQHQAHQGRDPDLSSRPLARQAADRRPGARRGNLWVSVEKSGETITCRLFQGKPLHSKRIPAALGQLSPAPAHRAGSG